MPCHIKNPANIDLSELEGHVQDLYTHVHNKVGFNKPPTMVFDSDPSNETNVLGKTAYYDPNTIQIHIYTDGRHPKDMLRSIAHELIHHWQNEEGRLDVGGYSGPGYYLKNKDLKGLEDEAMTLGTKLFRGYEDKKKLKENKKMSIKEWKNNELNRRLMKKFGILKETNLYKRDDELKEDVDENTGMTDVDGDDKGDTYMGHENKDAFQEDSGEEEKKHYEDNKMSDGEHIKAIEYHLKALKKDKDYDEDHETLEEGGLADRAENKEQAKTKPGRFKNIKEGDDPTPEDPEEPLQNPATTTGVGPKVESLRRAALKVLKKNKKLRLRFK